MGGQTESRLPRCNSRQVRLMLDVCQGLRQMTAVICVLIRRRGAAKAAQHCFEYIMHYLWSNTTVWYIYAAAFIDRKQIEALLRMRRVAIWSLVISPVRHAFQSKSNPVEIVIHYKRQLPNDKFNYYQLTHHFNTVTVISIYCFSQICYFEEMIVVE